MSLCLALMLGAIAVDTQLPAGNIVLDKIEGDRVYVHQDLRHPSPACIRTSQ